MSFYRMDSLYQQVAIEYVALAGVAKLFRIVPVNMFVNAKGNAQLEI